VATYTRVFEKFVFLAGGRREVAAGDLWEKKRLI
jgi:hypothetical protein